MAAVEITFDTANAAFDDDAKGEVARILREIAAIVEARPVGTYDASIRDINGNRVGKFFVCLDEDND